MRICFVGQDTYLALRPNKYEGVGGEAVQHALLARAFRGHGYDVSLVVKDFGDPEGEMLDGLRIHRSYRPDAGVPVLRYLYPRISGLWAAMRRADADVYYQSPAGMVTGLTALFCRVYRRLFIFRVASDANCIPGRQLIRSKRDRVLYEYGLRTADVVAAQTETQVRLLREHYGRSACVVPMIVDVPTRPETESVNRDVDVLWVSNLRSVKSPERLLDLAEVLPERRFVMVGGVVPGFRSLYEIVEKRAAESENLEFLGYRPNAEINALLARTKVFVNTSLVEGFPNTFLQAWARGVPVVSRFDPDGLINSHRLGIAVSTFRDMKEALVRLLDNPGECDAIGIRARGFVRERFVADAVIERYVELIRNASSERTAGCPK